MGVVPFPLESTIPVNFGPASRIQAKFELESRTLIEKSVEKNTTVQQYVRAITWRPFLKTKSSASGGCIDLKEKVN